MKLRESTGAPPPLASGENASAASSATCRIMRL
jgi:hypothetical protein